MELIEINRNNIINIQKDFIEYLDVSELSLKSYLDGINHFIQFLEKNSIKQPTRQDFKNFREYLKKNMTTNSVNTYLTSNRCLFKYLELNGIYPNITKDVKSIRTSNIPIRQTLTQEKCKEIYTSLTDKREKVIFGLVITTGLRANEVALAKIENIKMYNNEMVLFVKCKKRDDENEYVKLSQEVINDILEYIEQRTDGYIFVSTSNRNKGYGITNKSVRLIIKNILKRFGIDEYGFSCHSLRRTMATISYLNGADIVAIQQVLHQKSISTTKRYIQQTVRDSNKLEYNLSNLLLK